MVDVEALPKISADAHVDEPHDLWSSRLPDDLRGDAPHQIRSEADGGWRLVVNGEIDESGGQSRDPGLGGDSYGSAADENARREENASIDVRLAMMRTEGINAEIVYPTIGLYVYGIARRDVGEASCRVYNDWIHERLGDDCARVRHAALVPTWSVDGAIAELERVATRPGVAGLMLPLVGTPSWNDAQWEPLWSAIASSGLPMVMHQGTGHDMIFYRGWGSPTANLLATQSMAPRTAALLACSGVLERHPDLHAVLVEVNAGWMAWTMNTLDEYFVAHGAATRKPYLPELPSHYLRRQLHATFQRDPVAIASRALTGVECLMWGNDYPHPEGTYPDSNKVLAETLAGVDADDATAITAGNAARVLGFAPDVLTTRPE
jgi:predicted TIM-barrel fold metal-dependent hydrolase